MGRSVVAKRQSGPRCSQVPGSLHPGSPRFSRHSPKSVPRYALYKKESHDARSTAGPIGLALRFITERTSKGILPCP